MQDFLDQYNLADQTNQPEHTCPCKAWLRFFANAIMSGSKAISVAVKSASGSTPK